MISLRIWTSAVCFYACITGIIEYVHHGLYGGVVLLINLIVGCFVTSPILIPAIFIMRQSVKIPYGPGASLAMVAASLTVICAAYFYLMHLYVDSMVNSYKYFRELAIITLSISMAARTVRRTYTRYKLSKLSAN